MPIDLWSLNLYESFARGTGRTQRTIDALVEAVCLHRGTEFLFVVHDMQFVGNGLLRQRICSELELRGRSPIVQSDRIYPEPGKRIRFITPGRYDREVKGTRGVQEFWDHAAMLRDGPWTSASRR